MKHPGSVPEKPGNGPSQPEAPAHPGDAPASPELANLKAKYAEFSGKNFLHPERIFYGGLNGHPEYSSKDGEKHENGYLVRVFDAKGKPLSVYAEMHNQEGKQVTIHKAEPNGEASGPGLKTWQTTVDYNAPFSERMAFSDPQNVAPDHELAKTVL